MKRKYRIVTDNYAGYEVQYSYRWWPFWIQCGFVNTHPSVERAEDYAKHYEEMRQRKVSTVVKNLGELP